MIDSDDLRKLQKEGMPHPDHVGDPTVMICPRCGGKLYPVGTDEVGDPLYETRCNSCFAYLIRTKRNLPQREPLPVRCKCLYCQNKNIPGFAWCAPCAIKQNESLIGTLDANGKPIDEQMIRNRIEFFKSKQ